MKKIYSYIVKSLLFSMAIIANILVNQGQLFAQNAKIKSILFIGNSYTAVNDLPNWLRLIGESQGDTFDVIAYTPGGRTFSGHSSDPQVIQMLQQKNYDAVVLQEQSQLPSFPLSQVESDCYPYAKTLVDSARANNPFARIVFYSTWGRQNGDAQNCVNWPPVCTFKGMHQLLHDRYIQMAIDNYAWVAPVNSVWKAARDSSQMNLYQGDGSHPSYEGTHLAAVTIYQTIFHKSLKSNCFVGPVTSDDHKIIARNSQRILFDSLNIWKHDTCKVPTEFTFTSSRIGDTFSVSATATKIDPRGDYNWYLLENSKVKHLATGYQLGTIKLLANSKLYLKVKNACGTDSFSQVFSVLNIPKIQTPNKIKTILIQNATELIVKHSENIKDVKILDQFSKVIFTKNNGINLNQTTINISRLTPGIYFVIVNNQLHSRMMIL